VTGAALLLLPLLWARGGLAELGRHGRAIALVGVTNSALPFVAFSFAALHINAGLSSVLNATSPMFATLIAMVWLREPAGTARLAGLLLGLIGVVGLAWDRLGGGAPSAGPGCSARRYSRPVSRSRSAMGTRSAARGVTKSAR